MSGSRTIIGLLALIATLLTATEARAAFTICAVGSIRTIDSGETIPNGPNAGDTEDYWPNGDSTLSKAIPGIQVGLYRPGQGNTYEFTGSDGCADFSVSAAQNSVVTFYTNSYSLAGQILVVHDDPYDFTLPVGSTWTWQWTNQDMQNGNTYTYTNIGSGLAKWTAFFSANFAFRKWDQALDKASSYTATYLGLDESCTSTTNDDASAHYGGSGSSRSNGQITSHRHYLLLANCTGGGQLSRQKSIISHELGHAIVALYYGAHTGALNGDEPSSTDYNKDQQDGETGSCVSVADGYTITSKEWNSVAFREGFAHFVAAAAWNDKNDPGVAGGSGTGEEGEYTWFGSPRDLERFNQGSGSGSGGHLENFCGAWDSSGTSGDWLRFLWDFWSNAGCSSTSKADILKLYSTIRLGGGFTKGNYYTRSEQRMTSVFSGCKQSSFIDWAGWNGIDNDT